MRTRHNKTSRLLAPAALGAVFAIVAASAVTIMAAVARGNVRVGDIIAFEAAHGAPLDTDARLVVHRVGQFGCVLDLAVIRQSGGSMVVEAQLSDEGNSFRLHWAGERTTADSGDCGRTADLIVDHGDLENLALAAGGYGVGTKRAPVYTTALAN